MSSHLAIGPVQTCIRCGEPDVQHVSLVYEWFTMGGEKRKAIAETFPCAEHVRGERHFATFAELDARMKAAGIDLGLP